jgi:hypothetical protein
MAPGMFGFNPSFVRINESNPCKDGMSGSINPESSVDIFNIPARFIEFDYGAYRLADACSSKLLHSKKYSFANDVGTNPTEDFGLVDNSGI